MRRPLIILFLLIVSVGLRAGTEYQFKHYGMENGLSQNTVVTITQDQMGFMWFGTRNGLNRFDGHNIKTFYSDQADWAIGCDDVSALFSASDGTLWIGTDEGLYSYVPDTESFVKFQMEAVDGTTISTKVVGICNSGDDLVVATSSQGIFYYDRASNTLRHNALKDQFVITAIACDSKRRIWLSFYSQGLFLMDSSLKEVKPLLGDNGETCLDKTLIKSIIPTEQDQLFVGTDGHGVVELNINTKESHPIMSGVSGKSNIVYDMKRRGNEIVIGTENGLYVYEMLTHGLTHYQYEASNPYSLADNSIQCLYCDAKGGLWAGTYFSGVCYSAGNTALFDKYFPRLDVVNSLHGRRVREMVEDNYGYVWIGTEDGGLNRFDPSTGLFQFLPESASFPNIHGLCLDGDDLWVGTFSYGLMVVDTRTMQVKHTFKAANNDNSFHDNNIYSVEKTRNGDIYIGTFGGLWKYKGNGVFNLVSEVDTRIVYDIHEDSKGNLWVAFFGNGVACRNAKTGKWVTYNDENQKISAKIITHIVELSSGEIWLTSEDNGLHAYDSETDSFKAVDIPPVGKNVPVYSAVEDSSGKVWITTSHGLVCYDTATHDSRKYTSVNGILENTFSYNSALRTKNGRIYVGSLNGFTAFSPEQLYDISYSPKIIATDLFFDNELVGCFTEDTPLDKSIVLSDHITLDYDHNTFAIRLSSLLYANDEQVMMEYMLKGFEDTWQPMPDNNTVRFTNLPSGSYTLVVRAIDNTGAEVGEQYLLKVTVRPPFYRSWWAYTIYFLLMAAIGWMLYRLMRRRSTQNRRIAMQKFKYEKEQELYQSKISFFTNVAHEIRTPLTLIKAPLEKLLKRKDIENDAQRELGIMEKNVSRLLDLTNQLLDFRKTERDGLRLNIERCNVNQIVENVYERFTPLIQEKGIEATLTLPEDALIAFVDKESITKIISNIFTNAVKYCDHIVSVELKRDADNFVLIQKNDGEQVPAKLREKIFEPFERGNSHTSTKPGTGIGLALARALAEQHEGTLCMQNDDKMNVFALTIPIQKVSSSIEIKTSDADTSGYDSKLPAENSSDKPLILIVEDNIEMQNYERSQLEDDYNVLTAANGEEALKVLNANENTQLIISDVMMEPMGGFEFCKAVKNDVNYSHIPVILLTALTLDSAKIEGMESGADAYIEKPFSMDYLRGSVKNLLRQRQSAKTAYAASPFIGTDTVSISSADDKFLEQLAEVMEKNLGDSDFGITELAQQLGMSRTGLNRKIRGVFNMSPNNYIKVERLKRAAVLMKSSDLRVNEVCYQVGFTSPSYFTQCFFKQFGLLPKDFQDKKNEE